jgi:hypothetical protein
VNLAEALEALEERVQRSFKELRASISEERLDKRVEKDALGSWESLSFWHPEVCRALLRAHVGRLSVAHLHDRVTIVLYKQESPRIGLVGFPKVRCLSSEPDDRYLTCVFRDGTERAVLRSEIHGDSEVYDAGTASLLLVSEREWDRLTTRDRLRGQSAKDTGG